MATGKPSLRMILKALVWFIALEVVNFSQMSIERKGKTYYEIN